ncbi:DUF982 domain-containing protein [Sinorhizobium garamanticum]|uniref:DUF982 domain-containing protein n=1 Tax=Sinorhizobium garamanticum TaxID=680247 RepID=A0ABY8DHU0_9HYPH|nr:DUF982 domain-containing protein [Sinorhizobium garamanticum]WEX90453.1 DUF982 domain-containing protein [Sinorhizobium garamanticum]
MLNPELLWMAPVTVRMKDGAPQVFASVNDALDFLEGDWAVHRGRTYNRAVQTCRRALNRMTPVAIAREAFIDACRDAGMSTVADGPFGTKTGAGGQRSLA